jgi:PAS domain S-box-containing protein
VLLDITKRKEAEKALREAEVRYRTLVEQIPAITYIDRADGSDEPLYTSPQIEEMLGYTPEEWLEGRLWPERLHPDDKERVLAADERFEAGGERFSEEYRLIAKEGSVVWVREDAVVTRDETGEPLYWQGVTVRHYRTQGIGGATPTPGAARCPDWLAQQGLVFGSPSAHRSPYATPRRQGRGAVY